MENSSVDYDLLAAQVGATCEDNPHWLPMLANVAALLYEALDDINWLGFYLVGAFLDPALPSDELVLGPFLGKVACVRLHYGKGVCGTAAQQRRTLRVDDVHAFAGHIACDAASRSELVILLETGGRVVGVLDIDSPSYARFSERDQAGLEECMRRLVW